MANKELNEDTSFKISLKTLGAIAFFIFTIVGLWFTLFSGGTGLSGILSGKALELEVFSASWTLLGQNMTNYDVILLIFATMVLLMTVTLGLIPSFIKKTPAQWIPHNH